MYDDSPYVVTMDFQRKHKVFYITAGHGVCRSVLRNCPMASVKLPNTSLFHTGCASLNDSS